MDFRGCEKEALELFMKIDEKRQANKKKSNMQMIETPKRKISKEVKNLDIPRAMVPEVGRSIIIHDQ